MSVFTHLADTVRRVWRGDPVDPSGLRRSWLSLPVADLGAPWALNAIDDANGEGDERSHRG